jgi:glycine betaine/proline transport system permease protein
MAETDINSNGFRHLRRGWDSVRNPFGVEQPVPVLVGESPNTNSSMASKAFHYATLRLRLPAWGWAALIISTIVWYSLPIPHWPNLAGFLVIWFIVPAAPWLRVLGIGLFIGTFVTLLGDAGSVPESWLIGKDIANWLDDRVDWMVSQWRPALKTGSDEFLRRALLPLEKWLLALPWWLVIGVTTAIAYKVVGRRLAIVTASLLLVLTVLNLMEPALSTFAIVVIATFISAALGIPLGILSAQSNRFQSVLRPALDTAQTMPSFVYLVPVVMLLGIGKVPAVIATVIYAVPPMIRLTDLGIRQVDPELLEAARSFGATRMQLLLKVQVPLAMPTIMAGLNQTVMMALAMVVIASMIGARGLGIEVLNGINRLDFGRGLLGGIGIVIMAVVIDRISQGLVKDPMARDGAGEGEDAR